MPTPIDFAPDGIEPEGYEPPEGSEAGSGGGIDEEAEDSEERRKALRRIDTIVRQTEDAYRKHWARKDARNLAYWRGEFWKGDAHGLFGLEGEPTDYRAQQNEVFPAIDTITAALALDVPQAECIDARILSYSHVTRAEDSVFVGRRIAAPLNLWAEADDLDDTIALLVLGSNIFLRGGIVKTSWSAEHGRVIWRYKLPWQVFQDPTQPHIKDAAWVFERFPLHIDTLRQRIDEGVYDAPRARIAADQFPKELISDELPDDELRDLERAGLRDSVALIEYWDFRHGRMYHYHPESRQLLLDVSIPWRNPYDQLLYSPALGQPRQVATVELLAPGQRDINELVSARREMVERLVPRVGVDQRFFSDDDAWKEYMESTAVKPWRFKGLTGIDPRQAFLVSPAPDTTFDFNKHLQEATEHGRYVVGLGAMTRGQVENIRTAEEANAVRQNIEGRLNVRARRTVKVVRRLFDTALECLRWAIVNPEAAHLDMWQLHARCVTDVDAPTWAREIVEASVRFRILPFSPLMEDRNARRTSFERILPIVASNPALLAQFNPAELARELQESMGWRPSILAVPGTGALSPAAPAMLPPSVPPPVPVSPLAPPPNGAGGFDPAAVLAALGGGMPARVAP